MTAQQQAALLFVASRMVSSKRDDNAVHKAADAHYKPMLLAVQAAFNLGRKAIDKSRLKAARTGQEVLGATEGAAQAVRAALGKTLPAALLGCLKAGGEAGLLTIGKRLRNAQLRTLKPQEPGKPHETKPPFNLAFNVDDPRAIEWAKQHAAELAKDLSDTTREDIREAIARALEDGDLGDAYDDILAAVGDDARADMIARTEIMDAANEGNRQGWDQAVEDGLLPDDAKKVWIATSGCCDDCDELDGEEVGLDEEYPIDGGDGPPLHPNCRCTEGIASA